MKKMSELKGMPVLSLQEGEQLGQVDELIVDPATVQVVALLLDRRTANKEEQVVATVNVRSVGEAAITIEDRGSVVPISRIPRFQELARLKQPVLGKMVMSEDGTRMGEVADLEIDLKDFRVTSLVLQGFLWKKGAAIPAERIRSIGRDAVIVRAEAGEEPPAVEPPEAIPLAPGPAEPPAPAGTEPPAQ